VLLLLLSLTMLLWMWLLRLLPIGHTTHPVCLRWRHHLVVPLSHILPFITADTLVIALVWPFSFEVCFRRDVCAGPVFGETGSEFGVELADSVVGCAVQWGWWFQDGIRHIGILVLTH
jgi:hypothetical protein